MTSFQWRHHHYVTGKTSPKLRYNFFQFGPSQSKFLATLVVISYCGGWALQRSACRDQNDHQPPGSCYVSDTTLF